VAHKCRKCGSWHEVRDRPLGYPSPDLLIRLEPLLGGLLEAAREFDELGEISAIDFVEWIAVDAHRATLYSPNTRWTDGMVVKPEPRRAAG
jgi:hypothetical protein